MTISRGSESRRDRLVGGPKLLFLKSWLTSAVVSFLLGNRIVPKVGRIVFSHCLVSAVRLRSSISPMMAPMTSLTTFLTIWEKRGGRLRRR